jgi:PAS domain S-box-containing protein
MAPGQPDLDLEVLGAMDCGVMILDPSSGLVLGATDRAADVFALPLAEVRRRGLQLLEQGASPEDVAALRAGLVNSAKGVTTCLEMQPRDGRGRALFLEVTLGQHVREGSPCVVLTLRDISRRKKALAEQERLHKSLSKRVHELECLYNLFSVFESNKDSSLDEIFSDSVERLVNGWQYADVAYVRLRVGDQVFHTANYRPSPWRHSAAIVVDDEEMGELEVGYLEQRPQADEGPFLVEERELLDAVAGRLARIIERRKTQEELRRERDFAKNLVETAQVIVLVLDRDRRIMHFNPFLEKLSGYRLEEVQGLDWFDTFRPAELRDGGKRLFQQVMVSDQIASYLGPMLDREGDLHQVEWTVRPLRDHRGEINGLLCTGHDVTERLKVEQERNRLAAAVEQAAECVIITDPQGGIQYVNSAFENLTGYKRGEAVGQDLGLLKSGGQSEGYYKAMWARLKSGRIFKGSLVNRKKSGEHYEVECIISPIRDAEGQITHYLAHQRDITQDKRLREHLRQSQKMEAIGTLAGGIAHDFNNILGAIMGYAELSRLNLERPDHARSYMELALKASQRAKELVRQILTFSRQTEQERVPVDLNLILKESLKLLRATLPSTIDMRVTTLPEPATTLADPTQIHQVIMNLCTNAAHAMREHGGRLEVSLTEAVVAEEEAPLHPDLMPGPYLALTVSDTGHGMTAEVRERIFEPFFTTKAPGEGTGLGLAVVHGLVKGCKGDITVYSEAGQGTSVRVLLPHLRRGEARAAEAAKEPPKGKGRLLLVDDEEALVDILGRVLEGLGYTVTPFTNSTAALETFLNAPHEFDLVLSDLTMPNLTGLDLARKMKELRPDLPFLLCTGFSESVTQERAKQLGIQEVILKPILRVPLAEAIDRALREVVGRGEKGEGA